MLGIHKLLVALLLAASLVAQPAGTTPLSGGQSASVSAGATTAETQINNMPDGPMKDLCSAGIANFKKMQGAGRVINANGRAGTTGTSAHAEPEGRNAAGQATSTSGVGVGGEYICLGDKVPTLSPHEMGAMLVHEGIRTKQTGDRTPPPAGGGGGGGGGGWQPPLPERMREWHNDWQVYAAQSAYYSAMAALAQATPGVNPKFIEWCHKRAQARRTTAAENARNIGQGLQGKIK
ncbi:MAG: hypothetical protein ACK58T_04385 [Phycisphaerae bacterium]|jgi:hypothetical protein